HAIGSRQRAGGGRRCGAERPARHHVRSVWSAAVRCLRGRPYGRDRLVARDRGRHELHLHAGTSRRCRAPEPAARSERFGGAIVVGIRRGRSLVTPLILGSCLTSFVTTLVVAALLPKDLSATADIVGYPVFYAYNAPRLLERYWLLVGFFPVFSFVCY